MSNTDNSCFVNKDLYQHLFLIPAAAILAVLAFLNKRKGYRKDILNGRPALVIPFDFLGFDHNRFAISAIFGAITGLVIQVIVSGSNVSGSNNWSKAFGIVGHCLEIAFLCYPLFACLTTSYTLVGSILGFLYTISWAIVFFMIEFSPRCQGFNVTAVNVIIKMPSILCYLFILGKYLTMMFFASKKALSWRDENEDYEKYKMTLAMPWLVDHVRELVKPRFQMQSEWKRFMRVIYSREENFRFSVETVSIVVVCSIFLFSITIELIFVAVTNLITSDPGIALSYFECRTGARKLFGVALLLAVLITASASALSIVCFMDCHKNNMLRLFRGDTLFIPKALSKSQFMIGKCLKFAGFQIAYFVWGTFLSAIVIFLLTFVIIAIFNCSVLWKLIEGKLIYLAAFWVVAMVIYILMMVSSVTLFRDRSYAKNVIALENRNLYLVFSYFFFFLALPMGFFASIFRILKAMVIGFFMLPRIDRSVFPEGFQRFDRGFAAYICYLHVLAAHRNPVLRVFCQIVYNAIQQPCDENIIRTMKYRNKWFLLVTLMNNPQLQALRKQAIAAPAVKFIATRDVCVAI